MESMILPIVLAIFGSSGLWAVVNNIVTKKKDKKSASSRMILGLGYDKLKYLCNKHLKDGYITADDFADLEKYLFKPYVALGGDGEIERLFNEVRKLPTKF